MTRREIIILPPSKQRRIPVCRGCKAATFQDRRTKRQRTRADQRRASMGD